MEHVEVPRGAREAAPSRHGSADLRHDDPAAGVVIADPGRNVAGDATGLSARRKKKDDGSQQELAEVLPQASGGRKEYHDDSGTVTKVVEWFGYKLHLIVDMRHEVARSFRITDTKAGDGETLTAMVEQARSNLPEGRIETLAYDKAADSQQVHEELAARKIKPVIQNRSLWKEEPERPLPGRHSRTHPVHDEAGTV